MNIFQLPATNFLRIAKSFCSNHAKNAKARTALILALCISAFSALKFVIQIVFPISSASLRRSSVSAAYCFGNSACGPSDNAFSGQLWTST